MTLSDAPDVERLKAELRMAEVVRRAVSLRSSGEPRELVVRMEGLFVGVRERRSRSCSGTRAARAGCPPRRASASAWTCSAATPTGSSASTAVRRSTRSKKSLRKDENLNEVHGRRLAAPKPEAVVRSLLASRERLAEAADGVLAEDWQRILRRVRSGWARRTR